MTSIQEQDTGSGLTNSQSAQANTESEEFNPLQESPSLKKYGASPDNEDFSAQEQTVEAPEESDDEQEESAAEAEVPETLSDDESSRKEDDYDRRLFKLAKRDQSLRAKEKELKEYEKKLSGLMQLAEELDRDPGAVIQKLGVDPDKLYMSQLEKEKQTEAQRIRQLEQKLEDVQRSFEQKQAEQEARSKGERWESDFEESFSKEDYAMVRAWDPTGGIVRKIVSDRYEKTGKLMSPWKALDILQSQISDRVGKISALSSGEKQRPESPQARNKTRTVKPTGNVQPQRAMRELLSDEEDMERITQKYLTLSKQR